MDCCNIVSNTCADALRFGKFAFCSKVTIPVVADTTGYHYIEVYGNHPQEIRVALAIGDKVEIDMKWFNENEQVLFKIRKPDDTYLTYSETTNEATSFTIDDLEVMYANLVGLTLGTLSVIDLLSPTNFDVDQGYNITLTQDIYIGGFPVPANSGHAFWLQNSSVEYSITLLDNHAENSLENRLLLPCREDYVVKPMSGILIYRNPLGIWNAYAVCGESTDATTLVYDRFCIESRWVNYYRDDQVVDCEVDFEELIDATV